MPSELSTIVLVSPEPTFCELGASCDYVVGAALTLEDAHRLLWALDRRLCNGHRRAVFEVYRELELARAIKEAQLRRGNGL